MNAFPAPAYVELVAAERIVELGRGRTWRLTKSPTVLGATKSADIVLNSGTVSRRHAQLEWDASAGKWRLTDLRSNAGTHVNGQRVQSAALAHNDFIQLSGVALRFRIGEPTTLSRVRRRGDWLTFNAFTETLEYAVRVAGRPAAAEEPGAMHTASNFHRSFYKLAWDPVAARSSAVALAVVDDAAHIIPDVAGVCVEDIAASTRSQGAELDARMSLALAALMDRTRSGPPIDDETVLTWSGDFVIGARIDPTFWEKLTAIDGQLAEAGGPPSRDDVRGLLANLFPERARLDAQLREEVGVLGVEGLAKLIE